MLVVRSTSYLVLKRNNRRVWHGLFFCSINHGCKLKLCSKTYHDGRCQLAAIHSMIDTRRDPTKIGHNGSSFSAELVFNAEGMTAFVPPLFR